MIQPSDETPLPDVDAVLSLAAQHPAYTTAVNDIDAAMAAYHDAVSDVYGSAFMPLRDAVDGRQEEIADIVGGTGAIIDDTMRQRVKPIQSIISRATGALNKVEDGMMANGIDYPISHAGRLDVLNDPTGRNLMSLVMPAFKAADDTGMVTQSIPGQPVPGEPPQPPPGTVYTVEPPDMPVLSPPWMPQPVPPVTPIVIGQGGGVVPPQPWPIPAPTPVPVPPSPIPPSPVPPVPYPPCPPNPPSCPAPVVNCPSPPPITMPTIPPPVVNLTIQTGCGPSVPGVPPPPPIIIVSPPAVPGVPGVPGVPLPGVPVPVPTPVPPTPSPPGVPPPEPEPVPAPVPPTPSPTPSPVPPVPVPPTPSPLPGPGLPPPPEPPPPPSFPDTVVAVWDMPGACDQARELCKRVGSGGFDPVPGGPKPSSGNSLTRTIDTITSLIDKYTPLGAVVDIRPEWDAVKDVVGFGTNSVIPTYLPDNAAALYYSAQIATMTWTGRVTGAPMEYLSQWAQYQLQYCNSLYIPSQSEVNAIYLRDKFTSEQWECYTKANGNIPWLARKSMETQATAPNIGETVTLYMRGWHKTKDAYYGAMRRNGVLDEGISDQFLDLAKPLPTMSDIVTWMKRDAADETVVKKFKYDFEFTDKYKGKLKEWSEAQGISEEFAKFAWRSHWEIPSNTQLYDMLHRLRLDRPEVKAWSDANHGRLPGEKPDGTWEGPMYVTPSMVTEALQVNDNAPGWVPRLMAISYHSVTNSDARRMYEIGTITADDLGHIFRDNGYTEYDADRLVVHERANKSKLIANASGVMSIRKAIAYYKDGALDRADASKFINRIIVDKKDVNDIVDAADAEVKADGIRKCMKMIRRKFMVGELDATIAKVQLHANGIARGMAQTLVDQWGCERESRIKEPRVAMLCQWYTAGFIDGKEYIRRLENLGYTEKDSYRIAGRCWLDAMIAAKKESIKNTKEAIAELKRQAKEEKSDMSAAIKAAQDRIKDYQREVEKHQKELERQQPSPGATESGLPNQNHQ